MHKACLRQPAYNLRRNQISDSPADSCRDPFSYATEPQFTRRRSDEFLIRRLSVPAQNTNDDITEDIPRHLVDAAERVSRSTATPSSLRTRKTGFSWRACGGVRSSVAANTQAPVFMALSNACMTRLI